MATVTHENSFVSSNDDMGSKHEKAHDKQHKYQQEGEPNIENLTGNKPEDLSTDLALKMAQKQGLKTPEEWRVYNAGLRPVRRKDNYMEYVAGVAGNFIKSKRRTLDKGNPIKVKDKKTGKMVTKYRPLGKQKREQIAQELASIDKNLGIPIDGSLYYISNTMTYDQMSPEQLKKYRQFERKTLEDFYHSDTFKELNPGCFRAEIHFDENGAIHLQTQDVWYRKDSRGRMSYGKRATVKEILAKKYNEEFKKYYGKEANGEEILNNRLDVLCRCHYRYEKAPGSKDRIGAPTVAAKYWKSLDKLGPGIELTEKARTDDNKKVWPHKYSPKERTSRIAELWRMEQMKTLAEIASQNAKQMGINWTLDRTYTTDGQHRTGSAFIQHKEDMKGVNTEKVATGKKVNKLSQQVKEKQKKLNEATTAEQDAINNLKTAYEAVTGQQAKNKDDEALSPLEMANGLKRALTDSQKQAEKAKAEEATASDNLEKLTKQAKETQQMCDEAQQQLQRLQQRLRLRRQQRQKELQENEKLTKENTQLTAQNKALKADNNSQKSQNKTLKAENATLTAKNSNLKQSVTDLTGIVKDTYKTATGKNTDGLTLEQMVTGAKKALTTLASDVKAIVEKLSVLKHKIANRNRELANEPTVGIMVRSWIVMHWSDHNGMYGTGMESRINEYSLNKQNNGAEKAKKTFLSAVDDMVSHDEYVKHRNNGTLGQYHNGPQNDNNKQF